MAKRKRKTPSGEENARILRALVKLAQLQALTLAIATLALLLR
jgi:hypothetical protein